ncbi:MAG TPA: hypothetical protein VGV68_00710 [Terriglobia bacterium]|nr:hypothetical protein [Terriglobia bacterium]
MGDFTFTFASNVEEVLGGLQEVLGELEGKTTEVPAAQAEATVEQIRADMSASLAALNGMTLVEMEGAADAAFGGDASKFVAPRSVIIIHRDDHGNPISLELRTGKHPFRDYNPGNLARDKFTRARGAIGKDASFVIFPSADTGLNALRTLLSTPNHQRLTVDQAISRFAPPTENRTGKYQTFVRREVGVSGDAPLSSLSAWQRNLLEGAIERYEGFYEPGTAIAIQVLKPTHIYLPLEGRWITVRRPVK